MGNLKDLFVPKEIAIELKEIGFNKPCFACHSSNDIRFIKASNVWSENINESEVYAPTYEQVKNWFMEKHLIFITVNCEKWLHEFKGQVETSDAIIDTEMYHDYNEAFKSAIKAAIPFINKDNN